MALAEITGQFEVALPLDSVPYLSQGAKRVVILPSMDPHTSPEGDEPGVRESSAASLWARVREILDAALHVDPSQRAAYLDQACAGDSALRAEVESLIQHADQPGFIDRPALASMMATATMGTRTGSTAPLIPGQKVSHYEITGKIGEGGMGAVYKAVDLNLGRSVALKVISRTSISSDDKRRFGREAKSASALNHPNIVTIYEYNSESGVDFIAMEYVEGMTLDALLAQRRAGAEPPLATLLDYARQVASAVAKAHAAGIVHRDLKPSNIMITAEGVAKVLDFGLAKQEAAGDSAEHTQTALTQVGAVLGTPAYLSPEQAMGEAADFRADIFAFGIILYEIACGKRPFQGANAQATLQQIALKNPQPPSEINPALPAELCTLIDRCLRKDKEDRLPSLADAAAVLSGRTTSTVSAVAPVLAAPKKRRRAKQLALVFAGVLVLALVDWLTTPGVWQKIRSGGEAIVLPKSSGDFVKEGQAYLAHYEQKGYQDRAIQAFNKALEGDPKNATAYVGLAQVYLSQVSAANTDQQWSKLALESANKAIELNPYLAIAYASAGAAFLNMGKREEAVNRLEHALELDPKNALAHAYRAVAYEQQGDAGRAEDFYRRAIALAPSEWVFYSRLGTFLFRAGRFSEAVAVYETARKLSPDGPIILSNLGAAYHAVGRDEEAAAAFQRSLEANPTARGFDNLGTLLYYLGRYGEAAQAFEKSVELDAEPYVRWGNLGDAYRVAPGLSQKAPDAYRRAIQLAREQLRLRPRDADVQSRLAGYLAKSGDQKLALEETAAIDADSLKKPGVLFHLATVYELCQQRQKAVDFLGQALAANYSRKEVESDPELIELRKSPEYARTMLKFTPGK
jgi:tetratricopeptide (TPR) repeat protein